MIDRFGWDRQGPVERSLSMTEVSNALRFGPVRIHTVVNPIALLQKVRIAFNDC